jgi:predicted amidohydrolase
MREPLTIAAAQPRIEPHDVEANALAHAAAVREAGARVVVFPELSLTGYELDAAVITPDDPRLAPLVDACAGTGSIALAGAPVSGDHIAILAVDGGGAAVVYRKVWVGREESARFTPGNAPAVLAVDGWRLGLAVCRDTGIPQHAADTAALGVDAYVAGVLETREDSAVPDERARPVAAAHGLWLVTASYAGAAGGGFDEAAGRSGIWAPDGAVVAEAGPEVGAIARGTLRA